MCRRFFHFATMSFYITTEWWYRAVCRKILQDFHMGHLGKNRTKNLVRCYVYRPNMDKYGQYYHIVVNSLTKWLEVRKCKRSTTNCTIGFLHELFGRFGVVDCVVTDNGAQFTSNEFKKFYDMYQVKHIMTPQYHPRSKGQTERFVDTLKKALRKAQSTPTDRVLQQFLQVYRITPNPKYTYGTLTCRNYVHKKNKIGVWQTYSEQARFKKTVTLPKKTLRLWRKSVIQSLQE